MCLSKQDLALGNQPILPHIAPVELHQAKASVLQVQGCVV